VSALSSGTPIANLAEAERAIVSLNNIMDRLTETVEEETARVRAGRLRDAAELEQAKDELAARYGAETNRLKAAKDIIAASLPEALDRLRQRHTAFQANSPANGRPRPMAPPAAPIFRAQRPASQWLSAARSELVLPIERSAAGLRPADSHA
jgi:hypothetical protein